ncbi:hypothetical protein ABQE43_05395, partial [Mycolicibacter minnesotensis]
MRQGWVIVAVVTFFVAGCEPAGGPAAEHDLGGRSNQELARFLPEVADYPGPTWEVRKTIGPSRFAIGPHVEPGVTVDPAGCADIPFQRTEQIAASTEGTVPNAIAGNYGEASVRLMREPSGSDLIAESVRWAEHCHEYRQIHPSSGPNGPPYSEPTAVSILPPTEVGGVEVTRIHLTDNREHRFQAEGRRESVISLARVRGLVIVGRRHDNYGAAAEIMALTIRRLA